MCFIRKLPVAAIGAPGQFRQRACSMLVAPKRQGGVGMKCIMAMAAALAVTAMTAGSASAQDLKAKGEKVYVAQKCSMCHSIAGKPSTKGPLDDVGKKLSEEDIRLWLTDPAAATAKFKADRKPPMTSVASKLKTLSKDDVDALVAYMSSLKGK